MVLCQGRPGFSCLTFKCQPHQALNSSSFMFKIDSKTRIHSDFIFLSLPMAFSYPPTLCSLSTVRTFIKTKLTLIVPWLCSKPHSSLPIQVMELFPSVPVISSAPSWDSVPRWTTPVFHLCTVVLVLFVLKCSSVASLDLFLFFLKSKVQCLSVYLCLPIINE